MVYSQHIEPEYESRPYNLAEDALYLLANLRQQFKRNSAHSDVEMCLDLTIGALCQQIKNTSSDKGK